MSAPAAVHSNWASLVHPNGDPIRLNHQDFLAIDRDGDATYDPIYRPQALYNRVINGFHANNEAFLLQEVATNLPIYRPDAGPTDFHLHLPPGGFQLVLVTSGLFTFDYDGLMHYVGPGALILQSAIVHRQSSYSWSGLSTEANLKTPQTVVPDPLSMGYSGKFIEAFITEPTTFPNPTVVHSDEIDEAETPGLAWSHPFHDRPHDAGFWFQDPLSLDALYRPLPAGVVNSPMPVHVRDLGIEAMNAADRGGIDAAQEDAAGFRTGAGAQQQAVEGNEVEDLHGGFLDRLAPRNLLGRFAFIEHPGHDLPAPGMAAGGKGAGPELADQDDLVADRVVGQHGRGLAALEDLSAELTAHAAPVEALTEEVASQAEVALEGHGAFDEFGFFTGQGHRGHDAHSTSEKGPLPLENGPKLAPEVGIEPTAGRLTVACSTAELLRNKTRRDGGNSAAKARSCDRACRLMQDLSLVHSWRPGPESNRPGRICSPLHSRFATGPHESARCYTHGVTNRSSRARRRDL